MIPYFIMKRITIIIALILTAIQLVNAQNDVDALRYSTTTFGGTARYMSMSGSFGALGADFSVLSSNPGGIGLYKKSEFTFTPAFYLGETRSTYNGTVSRDNKSNFNISNVGFVFASEPSEKSIIRNWQFAIGMNRLNNFNNRMIMQGFNSDNSIIDTYVEFADGTHYENIENDSYGNYAYDLNLAWETYAIDTVPGMVDQYFGAIPPGGGIIQRKDIESWGSMNEFLMAFGANVGDRLYLGASFAFPFIRYFERSTYTETDEENNVPVFKNIYVFEDLKTKGTGFNMKFGMILRVTNFLRLGGGIHSPTWFNMRDNWNTEMGTEFDNNQYYSSYSPYGSYQYDLETPWKAMGSAAVILWRFMLINAEYEYVDYSIARLRSRDYNFIDENEAIRFKYSGGHNIRLGTELRFDHFAIRGGFGYYGSPFTEYGNGERINDGEKFYYSGGFGFRDKNFFVDLAYVRSETNLDYYLYGSENISVNPVKNEHFTNNVLLTLGFRY
jgi:hypothetical protein